MSSSFGSALKVSWDRFIALLSPPGRSTFSGPERRRVQRQPLAISVQLNTNISGSLSTRTRDVSPSGLFIETGEGGHSIPNRSSVHLYFWGTRENKAPIILVTTVVRKVEGPHGGIGVTVDKTRSRTDDLRRYRNLVLDSIRGDVTATPA